MNDLISIIVPVYNVELYLERCINSIISQTYKKIEIILINDGSTDNSEKICESFEKKDSRIKFYNKKNGGLSSARNYGITKATGKYISFIDSDDYIDCNFIYRLYEILKSSNSDISVCQFYKFKNIDKKNIKVKKINVKKYDKISALKELLLGEKFTSQACNKLYKKELFDEIRYPEGKNYEDIATTYLLFDKVDNIVVTNEKLYFYFMRENSIIHSTTKKNVMDFETNFNQRHEYLLSKYPLEIGDELKICYIKDIKMLFGYLCKLNEMDLLKTEKYVSYYKQCKKYSKKNYLKIIKNQQGFRRKIEIIIFLFNKNLYCKIVKNLFK